MKFKLITDSPDAITGMRLAGIEGSLVENASQAEEEIKKCVDDEGIGVVLITENIVSMCRQTVDEMKLSSTRPLVVTIPGSADDKPSDNIMRYVHEAMGIKI